jgi:hypothetical protein
MEVARILSELKTMGLTFRPDGKRLAHNFKPLRPVDKARLGELLYSLKFYHQQAIDYLRGKKTRAKVIPFPKGRGAL